MAVNRITNKQVVNKETVNRANQVSTKNTTNRGNRETTIVPGNNLSNNYSVTLKDIDTSVLFNIINGRISEPFLSLSTPLFLTAFHLSSFP